MARCAHGRRKSECKACGGVSICPHGKRRIQCKDCGGGSICSHGKRRNECKDCAPFRLTEYSVAEGCNEAEIMEQISCKQGDYLFRHVSKTKDDMEPILCVAPPCAPTSSHPRSGSRLRSPVATWPKRVCSASCYPRGSCGRSFSAASHLRQANVLLLSIPLYRAPQPILLPVFHPTPLPQTPEKRKALYLQRRLKPSFPACCSPASISCA